MYVRVRVKVRVGVRVRVRVRVRMRLRVGVKVRVRVRMMGGMMWGSMSFPCVEDLEPFLFLACFHACSLGLRLY